ncbi:diguanylate cyclase [Massilia sp. 9096]|uniref:GGDEF domain-containing protein n=1 Tax=Massilia sp. 9096 TaxID=1500894 RepID=UPI00069097C2|nr:GGDEF domain-containing protein [Massilia sp. 9096]
MMSLSIMMLFVLHSLSHSDARGIREWTIANGLAALALPLVAARGIIPDWLSIEVSNLLLMGTSALMLAGFRRHAGLGTPWPALGAGTAAGFALVAGFHLVVDSMAIRVVVTSTYHAVLALAMGVTLRRTMASAPRRYPVRFTTWSAFAVAAGMLARAVVYGLRASGVLRLDDSPLTIFFFSIGTLALPMLTLGAVMMTNAGIIARATYAADHDHLTGACSRRAFFALAERERARAQRRRGALSLLLFDVDHFKRINDSYGHATGDRVLAEIVLHTRSVVRAIDVCGRLGGEEFAVLLPDTGEGMAMQAAERLRAALERASRAAPGSAGVPYTVSIGVATLAPGETVAAMLSRADQALYAAKAGGRNTVVAAPSGAERLREASAG